MYFTVYHTNGQSIKKYGRRDPESPSGYGPLFRRRPKIISESKTGLVVLVLTRISQLDVIICLSRGFWGLWVVKQ